MSPQLRLRFAPGADGRTRLTQRLATYPYAITAPHARTGALARLTLQSISGGIHGGETLAQHITLAPGARAHLLQPAATAVRRQGDAAPARQSIRLEIGADASLIYETRPLIMLPGAALIQAWDITLAQGAKLLLADGFLTHNPQGGAADWQLTTSLRARSAEGRLLAAEHMAPRASPLACAKLWGFGIDLSGLKLPPGAGRSTLAHGAGHVIALAGAPAGPLCAALEVLVGQVTAELRAF
ncbi:urease accessory protein UreD [Acidocella facilis]|uniref:urease accessory protein UreD n=1 Tax=Acidocella facilis TaxID=525 RepID=UPI0006920271|nr:urease accessory protein UreD [Acidocella facilis]